MAQEYKKPGRNGMLRPQHYRVREGPTGLDCDVCFDGSSQAKTLCLKWSVMLLLRRWLMLPVVPCTLGWLHCSWDSFSPLGNCP